MEILFFCLNATIPVFLTMILGFFLNRIGFLDDDFANKINKFVFIVLLPILLFKDLSVSDFETIWEPGYVLFCFLATLFSILILYFFSFFVKDKSVRGEFIQGGFRGSAALLSYVFVQNVYGEVKIVALMVIGSVPLYNVAAVFILMLLKPEQGKIDFATIKKTLKGVIKNPTIIGITVGITWSLLKIPQPVILKRTVSGLAATATPLGIMALGALFDVKKVLLNIKVALFSSSFKLIILTAIFLPIGIKLGYKGEYLVAILGMIGSPTTPNSFAMARNFNHKGDVTTGIVMITTLITTFTLTIWLYIIKMLGLV